MAENKEQEGKIPVFTVTKNGAILKNIFIINKPSPLSISKTQLITSVENEEEPSQDAEEEEILIVGRHPDCHIMLTHPSISRFHLQIHSKPSSENLFVIDLSSVHGTWVSDKKIEPCVPVELNEGDTIRIGGSTRVYRLHWIPMSQAYDMDNPLVSQLDMPMEEVKEEENEVFVPENQVETHKGMNSLSIEDIKHVEQKELLVVKGKVKGICQDEISVSAQNEAIQSLDWILEGIVSLFSDEHSELIPKTKIPSSGTESMDLTCPVEGNISLPEEQQFDKNYKMLHHDSMTEVLSESKDPESFLRKSEKKSTILGNLATSPFDEKQWKMPDETEKQNPLQEDNEMRNNLEGWSGSLMKESVNSSLISVGILSEIKTEQVNKENQNLQYLIILQPSDGEMKEKSSLDQNLNLPATLNSASFDEECFTAAEFFEAEYHHSLPREGQEQKEIPSCCSALLQAESVNSSLPIGEVLSEITDNKNCQTPQSLFVTEKFKEQENSEISPLRSDKGTILHSIWSRRGKPPSALQIQTGRSRGKTTGDHNYADVQFQKQEDIENKSISKIDFSGFKEREEEIFTPDKENFSPNTLLLKSLKRKGKLENKHSSSCRKSFSKVTVSPIIQPEEDTTFPSNKENQTPKVLQEQKLARRLTSKSRPRLEQERVVMKKREERVPFQSLSSGLRKSEVSIPNATARSSNSVNFTQTMKKVTNSSSVGERRRSWAMVVDATTLLDKESRKSLQLLQGLNGTQLIIPRMVIRELDCLKRRGSLFRRTTEVSSLLEWIEGCMVKTKWWIHIQSSVEEGRPIAPTPPASPNSLFSEGNSGVFPCGTTSWGTFSALTSLTEIISPTAEDHILDCALLFKNMKNGQLVLLSNDVTLKIKAMAEGLICETAQEFRESLVNPFSERFLWADSSPRGLTWSYLDDVVLREKYRRGPLKKPSKGGDGAKGLKLILLHNSHYAKMSSAR